MKTKPIKSKQGKVILPKDFGKIEEPQETECEHDPIYDPKGGTMTLGEQPKDGYWWCRKCKDFLPQPTEGWSEEFEKIWNRWGSSGLDELKSFISKLLREEREKVIEIVERRLKTFVWDSTPRKDGLDEVMENRSELNEFVLKGLKK